MLYALLTFPVCDHEMLTDNRMLLQDPLFYLFCPVRMFHHNVI